MNIAFILCEFVTEKMAGGLATYYDNISRLLADAGHKVTIFVESDRTESFEYYPGVIVERVFTNLDNVDLEIPSSYIRTKSKALKKALQKKIDEGKEFDLVQYPNLMGYAVDRLNIPTVVRISSFRPLLRAADMKEYSKDVQYKSIKATDFIEDISVLKADAVYGPSKIIAEAVTSQTGVIPTVIESPFYPKKIIRNVDYVASNDLLDKKYILTFGTLKALKGAKLIGDSVFEILERCPDLYWVFAGYEYEWMNEDGTKVVPSEYIKEKAKQHSNRLIFCGKRSQEEVLELVEHALFCVLPSRTDNLPNTCIEAMAVGKVVVGTDGASFEQLIVDGENGFLTEIENIKMLIDCVCKIYAFSEDDLKRIGEKAKERIKEMQPQIILETLLKYYESVINSYKERNVVENKYYRSAVSEYNNILLSTGKENIEDYII